MIKRMTMSNPERIVPSASVGPLATKLRCRAEEVARSVDADGPAILWADSDESRAAFAFDKTLHTQVAIEQWWEAGRKSYTSAVECENLAEARQTADRTKAQWSQPDTLAALFDSAIRNDDTVRALQGMESGALELPARRIAAFSHRSCRDCAEAGKVRCGGCNGSQKEPCPSPSCLHGKQTCSGCAGRGGQNHFSNGSNTWITCGGCIGSGRVICVPCGGLTWIWCRGCEGAGNVGCPPCHATGWFTDRYEVFGDTKVGTPKAELPERAFFRHALITWAKAAFPGANKSGHEPVLERKVGSISRTASGGLASTMRFRGTALTANVAGSFDGKHAFTGTGIWLAQPAYALTRFLSDSIKTSTTAALSDSPGPGTIAARLKQSRLLSDLVRGHARSEQVGKETALKLFVEGHGAYWPQDLEPLADGYGRSKQSFSQALWTRTWKLHGGALLAVGVLFVALNVPMQIERLMGEPDMTGFTFIVTVLALAATLCGIVLHQSRWLKTRLESEMGDGAKLSDRYNPKLVRLAAFVTFVVAFVASSLTAVQGPARDGLFFMKVSLWYQPPTQPSQFSAPALRNPNQLPLPPARPVQSVVRPTTTSAGVSGQATQTR
jgi:hypothetical protein